MITRDDDDDDDDDGENDDDDDDDDEDDDDDDDDCVCWWLPVRAINQAVVRVLQQRASWCAAHQWFSITGASTTDPIWQEITPHSRNPIFDKNYGRVWMQGPVQAVEEEDYARMTLDAAQKNCLWRDCPGNKWWRQYKFYNI